MTDSVFGDDVVLDCVRRVGGSLPRGEFGVQLRDKRRPIVSLRVFAWQLRRATQKVGASLFINGNAQLARDVGAEGVHLGTAAGTVARARAIFGRACWVSVAGHSDHDVRRAVGDGADAVLVSPVFDSRSHSPWRDREGERKVGRGVEAIRSARRAVPLESFLYALGGVTADTATACAAAGADGVALVRGLLGSAEPGRVARAIHDAFDGR
ncbi:MAG TPA: thiamine phosphate synthase [Polyangiaceae bacterium]|nr:thiamine phosphate synthase [Polyangiaceae bacterium]